MANHSDFWFENNITCVEDLLDSKKNSNFFTVANSRYQPNWWNQIIL